MQHQGTSKHPQMGRWDQVLIALDLTELTLITRTNRRV